MVKAGIAEQMKRFMAERGLLCHASGSLLRLQPPLIVTEAQLREGLSIVDAALEIADAARR
jgi:4-aminobutyrate aminotransferase-like enzyme